MYLVVSLSSVLFMMVTLISGSHVKVPPPSCMMSYTDFQTKVLEKDWISLYAIDDMQELRIGNGLKTHMNFTALPNGSVTMNVRTWHDHTETCVYITKTLSSTRCGLRSKFAELQDNADRRHIMRLVSNSPDKYVIASWCWRNSNLPNGAASCSMSITNILVLDQRATSVDSTGIGEIFLNKIHRDEITDDLKKCFGREFDDDISPPVAWIWDGGEECSPCGQQQCTNTFVKT